MLFLFCFQLNRKFSCKNSFQSKQLKLNLHALFEYFVTFAGLLPHDSYLQVPYEETRIHVILL